MSVEHVKVFAVTVVAYIVVIPCDGPLHSGSRDGEERECELVVRTPAADNEQLQDRGTSNLVYTVGTLVTM